MKKIKLISLYLKNFKGIKELNTNFSDLTNIRGENATGKTTVLDGFTWLLFDKDSQDRKDFEIKTLDEYNNVIHGLEHEVTGVLNVDGKDITLSKIYKEKWTKKRGEAQKNLTGHETIYTVDEVPVKKSEYFKKINEIVDETLFKLVTNPLYFSNNMKWQDRREVLMQIIGKIAIDDVINYSKKSNQMEHIKTLLDGKEIGEVKRSLAARKKKLNEEIKSIPYRIDECNNSIKDINFEALSKNKDKLLQQIEQLDLEIADKSKVSESYLKEKEHLYSLKSKLKDMEYSLKIKSNEPKVELENRLREIKSNVYKTESDLSSDRCKHVFLVKRIAELKKETDDLRQKWFDINSKTIEFDEKEFICPVCKREFEESDIEAKKKELKENFNKNKASKLSSIQQLGKGANEKINQFDSEIKDIETNIKILEKELIKYKELENEIELKLNTFRPIDILENEEYKKLNSIILDLENKLQQPQQIDNSSLKSKKFELNNELEKINKDLAYKELNETSKARIEELMNRERELSQQIANIESNEFLCEEYIKTEVELLESSINSKFKYVRFKLFDTQINGGLSECCEALIDGVPFSNANTASQINAGLDIINALSDYYKVSAPIFIDNRESVNSLIETNSQIINLIVSKDLFLKIESEEK